MRNRARYHFFNFDLHGERRMENNNHRHFGQNDREDHLRDQPLHDHPDLYAAHNRRLKKKYIYDAAMGGPGYNVGHRPSCEHPLYRDHVLHKARSYQRCSLASLRYTCCRDIHIHVAGGVQLFSRTGNRENEQKNGSLWKTI